MVHYAYALTQRTLTRPLHESIIKPLLSTGSLIDSVVLPASVSWTLRMASEVYTSMRNLHTWPCSLPIMASTISCVCHLVWRDPKISFRCAWTRQPTISLTLSPYMTIYVYTAIPLRSKTNTCSNSWRQPINMASSSTTWNVRSGNPKSPSTVQYSLRKACGQIPPRPPHTQFPHKTSGLPRPDKLSSALHPRIIR